jgi:tetratricopeptide (TPR) repeat protein
MLYGVKMIRKAVCIIVIPLLAATCVKRAVPVTSSVPVAPVVLQDETLYKQGLAAFHEGTPDGYTRAAEAFRQASQLKPDQCEYALNLAQALLFLGTEQILNWEEFEPRETEAATVLSAATSTCVAAHEPFILRLQALIAGRGPKATGLINRAVDLDPNDAMNWLVLGYLDPTSRHLVTDQGSGKWVAMEHAVGLKPDSALIQYELGNNEQAVHGKEVEAKKALQRSIELNPRHFRAYLGLAYSADEDLDVEPLYIKVVELAPNFLEGRTALGSYYAALDEFDKAAEQYSAALAVRPNYDPAHFVFGLLMLEADRSDEAEQHFIKVVELNPTSFEAYTYLGNISFGRPDLDKAKNKYDQALAIRPNYPEAAYGLGHVYRRQNQTDLALEQFDKVIRLRPGFGDAYLSRGDIHAERRLLIDARTDYQKAVGAYEAQLRDLNASIAFAEAHSQSRAAQAQKKRDERDKARVEALLAAARRSLLQVEEGLREQ